MLDLDLEHSSDCSNDYLLIDNQRYCGSLESLGRPANSSLSSSSAATNQQPEMPQFELQFADSLPREIHLLLHTNAHLNEGRGFKILYEQLPCNSSPLEGQKFRLQNGDTRVSSGSLAWPAGRGGEAASEWPERQRRRLNFGQLAYPENYVSIAAGRRQARKEPAKQLEDNNEGEDSRELLLVRSAPIMNTNE